MAEWQPQLIGAAAFLGASLSAYLLFAWSIRRHRAVLQRIDEFSEGRSRSGETSATEAGLLQRLLGSTLARLAAHLLPGDDAKRTRLQQRMLHAGLYDPAAVHLFVTIRLLLIVLPVLLAVIAGTFGILDRQFSLLSGAVASGVGMLLPGFWLERKKSRRQAVLGRSLPDFLDLLVTCLESGLSLDAALRRVTGELRFAHPLLAAEMDRVQSEIDLGAAADMALHNLAERTDLETIHTLGTFIHQARRYGTSIADALRTHAEMLRSQREQRAEERAQKAAVKILFPTLLFIFPAVFVVMAGPAAIQLHEHLVNHKDQPAESTTHR